MIHFLQQIMNTQKLRKSKHENITDSAWHMEHKGGTVTKLKN